MNDAVLCITRLLREPQLFERVAYIDLDVHHGDGVQVRVIGTGYRPFNIQFSENGYAELALNFTFRLSVVLYFCLSFLQEAFFWSDRVLTVSIHKQDEDCRYEDAHEDVYEEVYGEVYEDAIREGSEGGEGREGREGSEGSTR